MDLKYPVGRFQYEGEITASLIEDWIREIEMTPVLLRKAVDSLEDSQLNTSYRPDGWTVRQVVHHLADSHINSYVRFKLALTETNPVIKPYAEEKWAELPDTSMAIEISLSLLESLHCRWVHLLRNMSPSDLEKTFCHPDLGEVTLAKNIGIYAWHGRHHVAHITSLRNRLGW